MAGEVAIHLSDLLGKLYALHQRDESDFAKLTNEQIEARAAQSDVATFFRPDAWAFVAGEVGKRTGIGERRLSEYAGMVNVGAVDGVDDVAAMVAKLDDTLTPILLAKLATEHAETFEALGLGIALAPLPSAADSSASPDALLTLDEAAKFVPGTRGRTTLWRWCKKGVNGVYLDHSVFGETINVTREAIQRFGRQCAETERGEVADKKQANNSVEVAVPSTGLRLLQIQQAEAVADQAGI